MACGIREELKLGVLRKYHAGCALCPLASIFDGQSIPEHSLHQAIEEAAERAAYYLTFLTSKIS